MAKAKTTPDGGHIIDVKRPGSAAPSSTSKPVIVTNRPILQDPMVVNKEEPEAKPEETISRKTAPEVKPLETSTEEPKTEEKTVPEAPEAPEAPAATEPAEESKPTEEEPKAEEAAAAEEPEEKPAAEEPAKADEPAPGEPTPESSDDKPVDGKDEGVANKDAVAEAEAEKKAKHDDEVEKLVDSKQYFLKVNGVEKKRSRQFVLMGVIISLLLALAWVDIALDAGLVKIGNIKPVTHFFSN